MAIGSILLGVALLVLVGIFIARPFLRPQGQAAAPTEQELLVIEKETLLDQIQALDFDHETGKIPTEVHAWQRERLLEQATAVLQALDAAGGDPTYVPDQAEEAPAVDVSTDIEIEAAVARLRQKRSQAPAAPAAAAALAAAAAPAAAAAAPLTTGQARFCPQCGTPTDPGDRFCAHCGHNLTLTASTQTA